ncbi:MAG: nucleotide-binding protein [Bacillota bacterium]
MIVTAIVERESAAIVAACLRNRNAIEDSVWITDRGRGPAALEDAARAPLDLLLLDINTGPGLGPAVLRYRLARPRTRVVLLAPGKVPGDIEVAGVVQAGVYDLVTDLDGLEDVLDRPQAGLAEAALWLDPSLAPGSSRVEPVRERVVERRVAVSQRPVLITVAGVAAGVGTTTVACALAGYLARRGYQTVLAEAGEQQSLAAIADKDLGQQPVQWLPNLDLCIEPVPRNLVRARQHAYVTADLGACPRDELIRLDADLVVVVLPQVHRLQRAVTWLQAGELQPEELHGLRYVIMGETQERSG